MGPVLEVKVTNHLDRCGIDIKIRSMQKDGRTQSWVVISRSVDKCVTELSEENKKPIHSEEAPSSRRDVKQKEQLVLLHLRQQPSLSINGKWNDIPAVGRNVGDSFKISKLMTRLFRRQGYPREDDGAIEWKKLLLMFHPDIPEEEQWTKQTWLNHIVQESNKNISVLLGLNGYLLYMRAIQGHSEGNNVDPSLQDNVGISYNRIDYIYHVGSFHYCNSTCRSGLIAGWEDSMEGRQAVDPMNEPQEDEPYDVTEPREVLYRTE